MSERDKVKAVLRDVLDKIEAQGGADLFTMLGEIAKDKADLDTEHADLWDKLFCALSPPAYFYVQYG